MNKDVYATRNKDTELEEEANSNDWKRNYNGTSQETSSLSKQLRKVKKYAAKKTNIAKNEKGLKGNIIEYNQTNKNDK